MESARNLNFAKLRNTGFAPIVASGMPPPSRLQVGKTPERTFRVAAYSARIENV